MRSLLLNKIPRTGLFAHVRHLITRFHAIETVITSGYDGRLKLETKYYKFIS